MTEVEQPPQNGIDLSAAADEDDSSKARPADIEQDMREMERRKRVEAIMGSKLFREELERIVDAAREGGSTGILQQLSDIVGMPVARVGNVFKSSNCMLPINDIRGVESMGYAKGEKILRCKLAATFRLLDLYGWTQGLGAQITARLKVDQEYFLVNPYGLLYHEITASSLNKVDMQGQIVEQGTTNFGVNKSHFVLHSAVHAARPDIRCAIYIGCSPVVAISSLKTGLLPLTKDACLLGEITTHAYTGSLLDAEERDKLVRNLGPNSKVMLLANHGALCCGETIEEAFFAACHIVQACETQLKLLPVGVDNLVLIPEESRKVIYEQSRRPPEDLEKKFAAVSTGEAGAVQQPEEVTVVKAVGTAPKWRVGGAEFEALMRMLDNAGYRTGYIYRHPLIKSEPPKPKNDVELPPAVSSLGYLLEEEELYRQGIWKKGDLRKGGDRSRWLNSPNVYQKVEVLETGTPDPKKITKWVAEGSPTHSTPVRIEDPLQFVPAGTNPKEFKRLQQQIKDNRRADIISAGPQSHILEGVTWDEANRIKDATVSSAGDHVVLMGAASKGIIQRGYQHNATVYKAPYAKNPFDNVTDDELNEYKRTVERKKKSIHGEYTDTDFSESEPLSSLQTSGAQQTKQNTTTTTAAVSQSEPEDVLEHQVMRIETQQAPVPSQPEVVLSDDLETLVYVSSNKQVLSKIDNVHTRPSKLAIISASIAAYEEANKENRHCGQQNIQRNCELIAEMKNDVRFRRQKEKFKTISPPTSQSADASAAAHVDDDDDDGAGCGASAGSYSPPFQTANESTLNTLFSTTANSYTPHSSSHPLQAPSDALGGVSATLPCFEHAFARIEGPRSVECCAFYYEPYMQAYEAAASCETQSSMAYMEAGFHSEPENVYKKSIFCYTPAVCDSIFEALQRPIENELIFNIPFSAVSPCSTTRASTPRKTRADSPYKQTSQSSSQQTHNNANHSPYRTVSHFGFNPPQREPQPEHKHLPLCPPHNEPKKYVPLQRSVSYEEIFSSPRYVDLCENCFERVVRLKPELLQIRTRLRNLMELHVPPPAAVPTNRPTNTNGLFVDSAEAAGMEAATTNLEFIECNSSDTTETLPPFSTQLEPLIEAEEDEECEARHVHQQQAAAESSVIDKTVSSSSFIEKIMRMNYSEESANANFLRTPHTISSNLSLELIEAASAAEAEAADGDAEADVVVPPKPQEHEMVLCAAMEALYVNETATRDTVDTSQAEQQPKLDIEVHASVTEIWEFGDWQTQQSIVADNEAAAATASNVATDMTMRTLLKRGAEPEAEQQQQPPPEPQRALMSRDERSRRKLEFQELWEDHISYFNGKEMNTLSDTESALDDATGQGEAQQPWRRQEEQQSHIEPEDGVAPIPDLELHTAESASLCAFQPQEELKEQAAYNALEVFHGRSLIVKTSKVNTTTTTIEKDELESATATASPIDQPYFPFLSTDAFSDTPEPDEEPHSDGCVSSHTYNVHSSEENLFFRAPLEMEHVAAAATAGGIDSEAAALAASVSTAATTLSYTPTVVEFELYQQHAEDVDDVANNTLATAANELQFEDLLGNAEAAADNISEHFNQLLQSVEHLHIDDDAEERELQQRDAQTTSANEVAYAQFDNASAAVQDVVPADCGIFNELELKILRKIEQHQLKQTAEIFNKIETSIRNKLTPSKLEQLLQKRQEDACTSTTTLQNFAASTPAKELLAFTAVAACSEQSFHSLNVSQISATRSESREVPRLSSKAYTCADDAATTSAQALTRKRQNSTPPRRSRSLTTPRGAQTADLSPAPKLSKTSSPPLAPRKSASSTPLSARSIPELRRSPSAVNSTKLATCKRNFIQENIRNVSQSPRAGGMVKRLQGNPQSIFGRNPFGPRKVASPNNSTPHCSSRSSLVTDTADSGSVYSFQSKLVHGAQRFWVSMPQATTPASGKKLLPLYRRQQQQQRRHKQPKRVAHHHYNVMSSDSTGTLDSVDLHASVSTHTFTLEPPQSTAHAPNVEREIEALSVEIEEMKPRLETYKSQLQDYGAHMARCARNMDECMEVQQEIAVEQQQLREEVLLHQYREHVACDVQTYSLSEAED